MKTNEAIGASKRKAVAWGDFLLDTFSEQGITDNEVIRNCHIGRSTFYRMKRGELINVDAYLRMTDYAIRKIRERMKAHPLPGDFETGWWEECRRRCFNV